MNIQKRVRWLGVKVVVVGIRRGVIKRRGVCGPEEAERRVPADSIRARPVPPRSTADAEAIAAALWSLK